VIPEVLLKLKVLKELNVESGEVKNNRKVCERGQNCSQNLVPA
jgi:hypothetical protein